MSSKFYVLECESRRGMSADGYFHGPYSTEKAALEKAKELAIKNITAVFYVVLAVSGVKAQVPTEVVPV